VQVGVVHVQERRALNVRRGLLHRIAHNEHSEHGAARRERLRHPHQGGDDERLRAEWAIADRSGAGEELTVPAHDQCHSAIVPGDVRRRECPSLAS
jgi:hypothetical protein